MIRRRKTAEAAAKSREDHTAEAIRAAAAQHATDALAELARIMREGKSEPARIAAAKELLDRAQSRRSAAGSDGKPSFVELVEQAAKEREQEEALAQTREQRS